MLNAILQLKQARIYERQTKNPKKSPFTNLWQSLYDDFKSFKPILERKYETICDLPDCYRRFKEKVENYEKDGYKLLLQGYHFIANRRKVDAKTNSLLESIFTKLGYKPNYYEAYTLYTDFINGKTEFVHNETGEMFNPSDFAELSPATVRNYLARWESRIATHKLRSGDRQKYMSMYKPPHKMNNKGYAGSIISVDDRQPPFEYADSKRVWFYLAQDPASECFTTWVHGMRKEGIIIEFYRQMVRNYAAWGLCLPAELECESSLNSAFRNTLLREGNMFQYVRIEANNARGKYIEAGGNRRLRYGGEKEQIGWLARPHARLEANQQGSEREKVPQLPYKDIVDIALKEIEEHNNMPHPNYEGKTRWEVFLENQNPQLTPINWRGILPYIGHKTQTSCKAKILVDECGIGKTFTAKYLSRTLKNCFYVDASQAKTKRAFIRLIARTLGIDDNGHYTEILANVKYYLHVLPQPIIIIDEAGDLDYPSFLAIKELWNATENVCGWYMMGADGLQAKIERGISNRKVGFREIYSRFSDKFSSIVPVERVEKLNFYKKLITDVLMANCSDKSAMATIVKKCLVQQGGNIGGLRRAESLLILSEHGK